MSRIRRRLARSRFAASAALPLRLASVLRHDASILAASGRWLVSSREHTNFTYDLTDLNLHHLAWWVAEVTRADVETARTYIREVQNDEALASHIVTHTSKSGRRRLADQQIRLHKRVGWYAIARIMRPQRIVETGTDKGLGSAVLAAALLRNGRGRLLTLDTNPESGYLIGDRYGTVTDRVVGDSLAHLTALREPVDMFLHDSLHTYSHEFAEYKAVDSVLTSDAIVLSDNAHATAALPNWAEQTGRRFLFFSEDPMRHWYPGGGIGAAWRTPAAARPNVHSSASPRRT